MKSTLIYISLITLAFAISGCEENEIMPSYKKIGTSTSTVIQIILPPSDDPVTPSEVFPVTVNYVNPSIDPLLSADLFVKVGDGEFTSLESWNVSSEPKDELISHTLQFQAPATVGTKVTFEVIVTSGKDYEQRKRASVDVVAP